MISQPAIIVIGFNRPNSLQRLLSSLEQADYSIPSTDSYSDVCLVISVDHCDSNAGDEVRKLAEDFHWSHGEKRLIFHDQNLGLRKHVLSCGDLSREYGAVIVLEDDLSVGSAFYRYATEALGFTDTNDAIGGVSLYNHRTNFLNRLPFTPIHDGYDNYYLQIAQSWGQAWTKSQWNGFRSWYDELASQPEAMETIPPTAPIPKSVANWPKSSWLKYCIWYLAETNKYFLYPHVAHSTNHSDSGTHMEKVSTVWQVPLAFGERPFSFSSLDQSLSRYDSFFEIAPENLKKIAPHLAEYDFDVDLFGTKTCDQLQRPYVLTSKVTTSPILEFGLTKKPFEANFQEVAENSADTTFSLAKREHVSAESRINLNHFRFIDYFYGFVPLKTIGLNLARYFMQKKF